MRVAGGSFARGHVAQQWDEQGGDDKCGHDRAKGACRGEGRGLAIGEQPELFQSGNVAPVETARKIRIALCEGIDQSAAHRDADRLRRRDCASC
jgi:hypothetical protein